MAQENRALERILAVLVNSRSNEAQQLLRQGIRHAATGEYREAEERFRRALDCDSTDYQVLLNLAFIEIHKGDASAAGAYFRKALALPVGLDSHAQGRVLWAWARLDHVERHHEDALQRAKEAMALGTVSHATAQYVTATYAAAVDDVEECLERLESAVMSDATLFAKAAVEPDLAAVRAHVLNRLSEIAAREFAHAKEAVVPLRRALAQAQEGQHLSKYNEVVQRVAKVLRRARLTLHDPSFDDVRAVQQTLGVLRHVLNQLPELDGLEHAHAQAHEEVQRLAKLYQDRIDAIDEAIAELESRHQALVKEYGPLSQSRELSRPRRHSWLPWSAAAAALGDARERMIRYESDLASKRNTRAAAVVAWNSDIVPAKRSVGVASRRVHECQEALLVALEKCTA